MHINPACDVMSFVFLIKARLLRNTDVVLKSSDKASCVHWSLSSSTWMWTRSRWWYGAAPVQMSWRRPLILSLETRWWTPAPTRTRQWSVAHCCTDFAPVHREAFWPRLLLKVSKGWGGSHIRSLSFQPIPCYTQGCENCRYYILQMLTYCHFLPRAPAFYKLHRFCRLGSSCCRLHSVYRFIYCKRLTSFSNCFASVT